MYCLICQKSFKPNPQRPRQIYCSSKCSQMAFHKRHPGRNSVYQHKYRLSIPVLCRYCHEPIPSGVRKSGLVFCSDDCRKHQKRLNSKKYNKIAGLWFEKYKTSRGCQICGYNKCGRALDFHHKDPSQKLRRIERKHLKSRSKLILAELKKCLLLCKNCHAELHSKNC